MSNTAEQQVRIVVDLWSRYLLRVCKTKKLAFVYLANDLIQKSLLKKSKGTLLMDYHEAFSKVIEEVLLVLFDIIVQPDMFYTHLSILKVI